MNTNLTTAQNFLRSQNILDVASGVDANGRPTLAPTYGLGRGVSAKLESLAKSVVHIPTKRATKKNPKTLPVYTF